MPSRWRSRPKYDDLKAGARSLAGHEPSFARTFTWTFRRRLLPASSHSDCDDERCFVGHG